MSRIESVEAYLESQDRFRDELAALRALVLESGLQETIKWGAPCYVWNGSNVVGLAGFKDYFGLWFFQGALLEDRAQVLVNAQAGRTRAMRQWRMASMADIDAALIRRYVEEARALAAQGRSIAPERGRPVDVPPALQAALDDDPGAAAAFEALTLGRRREFAGHVADARREDTRRRRVEKVLPLIRAGVGLNDRYRRPQDVNDSPDSCPKSGKRLGYLAGVVAFCAALATVWR